MSNVASTIVSQLGGNQIFAMAFAKGLTSEDAITLFFAKGLKPRNKADRVTITLCPDDTYRVEFLNYHRAACDIRYLGTSEGVYADGLRQLIEQTTGLYLTLGRVS